MAHIMIWRGRLPEDGLHGFWHHGILCSDGSVIHYSGMNGMKTLQNATIQRTDMGAFAVDDDRRVHEVQYGTRVHFSPETVEARAASRLGERGYDLMRHNCENFARWCVVGDSTSFQVQGAWVGAAAGVLTLVLSGGGLLGAALTGVVAQRVWDSGRNVSEGRQTFNEDWNPVQQRQQRSTLRINNSPVQRIGGESRQQMLETGSPSQRRDEDERRRDE